jgi:hypothetical protein
MLTLINTNTMQPAIAPVGLDYIAGAAKNGDWLRVPLWNEVPVPIFPNVILC